MSAGNSQRISSTVSECQEELNNAIVPLSMTCRRAKPRPSSLPKQQTYSTATVREWECRPSHVPTMENGLDVPIFLPDNRLRQRSLEAYATKTQKRRRHDQNNTTVHSFRSTRPPLIKSRADVSDSISPPHGTPNTAASVLRRKLCTSQVHPRWTTDVGPPFSCPTIVYGF